MIGSGFSRNAEGGDNVGTWEDLARALAKGLTPGANEATNLNAANAIQLAEQYERLFSRPALEQLLKDVVPDERLSPGSLHVSLLALGWSEVFTTNYDTLLERAAEKLLDSSYITVSCREDIPQSKVQGKRRIVKLHGSFASQRPFVVTEEDYRTYPSKFAPFVNLVRQALLENVLCLIGFSGDDPNFLHWIGWVRDMLDKHALPIYLFLSKPPSLGQRKLLQARGVTPIVLPSSKNGEPSDYRGRYIQLFEELSRPLEDAAEQWGEVSWPSDYWPKNSDAVEQYRSFKVVVETLVIHRRRYPGWLVAPKKNRQRFERSVSSLSHWNADENLVKSIKDDSPVFALVALDLYAWLQGVLLHELLDPFAELALSTLENCRGLSYSRLAKEEVQILGDAGVDTQSGYEELWGRLAVSVLAWTRQGPRDEQYVKATKLIREVRPTDKFLADHLKLNEILLHISNGQRVEARYCLTKWRIRGEDPFMEVRRAMLVAELGDSSSALSTCERTILLLRQQQRHKPNDPMLVSMESWACFVSAQLSRSLQQQRRGMPNMGVTPTDSLDVEEESFDIDEYDAPNLIHQNRARRGAKESSNKTKHDERIDALSLRGYDSNFELDQIVSELNQDFGTPIRERTKELWEFELGSTSEIHRFGAGIAVSKLRAAMAWLQLVERVGLIPSTSHLNLFTDEFLLAAWWTRYFDPLTRGVGVLIRCLAENALKPRDEYEPRHQTGWLSRAEVAKLPEGYVAQVSEASIAQLEWVFQQPRRNRHARLESAFFSNILGRLAIRVTNQESVLNWAMRLIALHGIKAVQESPESWSNLTRALARCMSALEPAKQWLILTRALLLPIMPPGDPARAHQRRDWINCIVLFNAYDGGDADQLIASAELTEQINIWVTQFCDLSRPEWERTLLANRIFVVQRLGLIPLQLEKIISQTLWEGNDGTTWPILPGFLPIATLLFAGTEQVSPERAFAKHITGGHFRPFASGGNMQFSLPAHNLTWHVPGDRTQIDGALELLKRRAFRDVDIRKFTAQVREWLTAEAMELKLGMERHDEMRAAVRVQLDALDRFFAAVLLRLRGRSSKAGTRIIADIQGIPGLAKDLGMPFLRLAFMNCARDEPGESPGAFMALLSLSLTSTHEVERTFAFHAAHWIMKEGGKEAPFLAAGVLNLIASMIAGRDVHATPIALESVAALGPVDFERIGTVESIYILDITLERLRNSLKYVARPGNDEVRDELVPLFRYRAAQLAATLQSRSNIKTPGADAWIEEAAFDPLPELRLGRFKYQRKGGRVAKPRRM